MTTILVELFRHNQWANLRLLDACAGLSDQQLDGAAPGAYGPIRATLVHIAAAQDRYLAVSPGERPERVLREGCVFPGFDDLRDRLRRSSEALTTLAEATPPARVLRGLWRGEPYAIPASVVLIQAINHATEHRAQVTAALSQRGIEPPPLDGWAYGEVAGG